MERNWHSRITALQKNRLGRSGVRHKKSSPVKSQMGCTTNSKTISNRNINVKKRTVAQLIMSQRMRPRAGNHRPHISIQKRRQSVKQTTKHLDMTGRKKPSIPTTRSRYPTWDIQLDTVKDYLQYILPSPPSGKGVLKSKWNRMDTGTNATPVRHLGRDPGAPSTRPRGKNHRLKMGFCTNKRKLWDTAWDVWNYSNHSLHTTDGPTKSKILQTIKERITYHFDRGILGLP